MSRELIPSYFILQYLIFHVEKQKRLRRVSALRGLLYVANTNYLIITNKHLKKTPKVAILCPLLIFNALRKQWIFSANKRQVK